MKILTYQAGGPASVGILFGDQVLDLAKAASSYLQETGEPAPTGGERYRSVLDLLEAGSEAMAQVEQIVSWVNLSGKDQLEAGAILPLDGLKWLPPVQNPSKVVCVGLNYADHCREQNLEVPKSPVFFAKFSTALIGHEDHIQWPPAMSQKVDYEAELAVVIGRKAVKISAEEALDYVAGYSVVNDVSARDVQFADQQWTRGKSFDTFCPLGPYLVTANEIENPHNLAIRCWVNGEILQDSNTDQLIFKIPQIISFLSQTCTLLPGDIISTGTPDGVGVFRDPPRFLKPGDVVEVEVEKIGRLRNTVV